MTMKSLFPLILLVSLALYTSNSDARKDPGEYWRDVMKNEPMPEAIKHLMPRHSVSLSKEKTDCYTSSSVGGEAFEPRPNVSVYHDDAKLKEAEKSKFSKEFEPRPSTTSYHDDTGLKQEKSFAEEFEPRPSLTSYHDDAGLKQEKSFAEEFEPRPSITTYLDDAGLKQEKSFAEEFEPRPNVSVYHD
ncbi:organ-specific protein P4-like [Nicotiana sylvestris]|uniref:Organ-specific protein P4-like n=1 Tax=Nicotiana sylvestris TaxID=4096 RepID=A0A1U7V3V0_NICSY|nr:PREDICTED: organ-specific protein P4-like [Nicotiana sylvestris]